MLQSSTCACATDSGSCILSPPHAHTCNAFCKCAVRGCQASATTGVALLYRLLFDYLRSGRTVGLSLRIGYSQVTRFISHLRRLWLLPTTVHRKAERYSNFGARRQVRGRTIHAWATLSPPH